MAEVLGPVIPVEKYNSLDASEYARESQLQAIETAPEDLICLNARMVICIVLSTNKDPATLHPKPFNDVICNAGYLFGAVGTIVLLAKFRDNNS